MRRFARMALLPLLLVAMTLSARIVRADDIVDTAAKNDNFSTLVTAIKAADLVDTLKGAGPFTVFAPTNEAFAKLKKKIGAKKFEAILADKAALTSILTYHVISGKVMAASVVKLKNGSKVKTVEGAAISIFNKNGVRVNKANVVKTDIECDNGVIHVIDAVLLPPAHKMKSKM